MMIDRRSSFYEIKNKSEIETNEDCREIDKSVVSISGVRLYYLSIPYHRLVLNT